jgi:hypothetical protein
MSIRLFVSVMYARKLCLSVFLKYFLLSARVFLKVWRAGRAGCMYVLSSWLPSVFYERMDISVRFHCRSAKAESSLFLVYGLLFIPIAWLDISMCYYAHGFWKSISYGTGGA